MLVMPSFNIWFKLLFLLSLYLPVLDIFFIPTYQFEGKITTNAILKMIDWSTKDLLLVFLMNIFIRKKRLVEKTQEYQWTGHHLDQEILNTGKKLTFTLTKGSSVLYNGSIVL